MSVPFPYLFSPLRVGQLTLRNRIVSTPHATGYVIGYVHDEREVHYQGDKAKGGVGWQFMGATNVVKTQGYLWLPANVDDTIVPIYRRIAAAVHAQGGLIGAQLTHVGAMGDASRQEMPLPAPSAIANDHERQTPSRRRAATWRGRPGAPRDAPDRALAPLAPRVRAMEVGPRGQPPAGRPPPVSC